MIYFIIAAALLLTAAIFFSAVGLAVIDQSISRRGVARARARLTKSGAPPTPYRTHMPASAAWWSAQSLEPCDLASFDGTALHGYLLRSSEPTKRVALVMHGHDCDCASISFISRMFHEAGYHVLAPEMRCSRESGGECYSFGLFESIDAVLWLRKAVELFGPDCRITAYGNSLGGATVCMLSGRDDLPEQLRCIVSDCAFSDLYTILLRSAAARMPAFLCRPALLAAELWCRALYGFSIAAVRPIDAVAEAVRPLFFVHGADDTTTLPEMSRAMYELAPVEKELLILPDCRHGVAYFADTQLYTSRVLAFTDRYTSA